MVIKNFENKFRCKFSDFEDEVIYEQYIISDKNTRRYNVVFKGYTIFSILYFRHYNRQNKKYEVASRITNGVISYNKTIENLLKN